jgi:restriction system protein
MPLVSCPACRSNQSAHAGVGGMHCMSCQRDVWFLKCRKCGKAVSLFGSATGSGNVETRCPNCKARNQFDKSHLRAIITEARRLDRVDSAAARSAALDARARSAHASQTMQAHVESNNSELQKYLSQLDTILKASVTSTSGFSISDLKVDLPRPTFSPGALAMEEALPDRSKFVPAEPHGIAAHVPGARKQFEQETIDGDKKFQIALQERYARETARGQALAAAKANFDQQLADWGESNRSQHAQVDDLDSRYRSGASDAIVEVCEAILAKAPWPFERVRSDRIAFSEASKQLIVELELPNYDVVPEVREYKFVKTRNEESASPMPATHRRAIYTSLISQAVLRALHEIFSADSSAQIDAIVLNGHVETVDPRNGQTIHPCLVTLRTTREVFLSLNLVTVEPAACLKGLNASVSKSPAEIAPVRPVLEFNMVDPRFVSEADIISGLDIRPNLMDLSPSEFESLITNLFEKMGLETRLTQASRDGGVDCVAYDSRPILGGKVVIQAKRYKNTVGVSAVRDLFGTMQNEGASKGILVTTSGYGAASFTFATGKPLELLDGANLLYLLKEHADVDAVIVPPDDWSDPIPDSET